MAFNLGASFGNDTIYNSIMTIHRIVQVWIKTHYSEAAASPKAFWSTSVDWESHLITSQTKDVWSVGYCISEWKNIAICNMHPHIIFCSLGKYNGLVIKAIFSNFPRGFPLQWSSMALFLERFNFMCFTFLKGTPNAFLIMHFIKHISLKQVWKMIFSKWFYHP